MILIDRHWSKARARFACQPDQDRPPRRVSAGPHRAENVGDEQTRPLVSSSVGRDDGPVSGPPRVLVLGSGFAGLWAALGAARRLDELGAAQGAVDVTVVSS